MINPTEDRILLINKPLEWTSFDVVRKVRGILKLKKVGHAGTLDPLATGLLILCTGKMTKRIEEFQAQEKEYTGKMIIGQTTPSYDLETEPTEAVNYSHVSDKEILAAAKVFEGEIDQVPPLHSAIKVDGKRAYQLARAGKEAALKSRKVTISVFEITSINLPEVSFKVVCTKGTYIRSLARDFGNELGVGAYLAELCRTRIGNFLLEDAIALEDLAK
ncbi:MAG TPA: tRNA pseudouridine(55) synthase TruB [Cyclobacteriaceae bacterium]|nr:tRNA pseudouridine(55) synthase TruB [Cyclobacteriaceae bacterium]